jgi:hypothetical protein
MPRPRRVSSGRTFTGEEGKQRTLRHLQGNHPDARSYPSPDDALVTQDLPYSHPSRTKAGPAGVRAFDAESPGPDRSTPVRSFHNPATGLPVPLDRRNDLLRRGLTEDEVIFSYDPYVPPAQRPSFVREQNLAARRELIRRARRGTL